MIKFNHLTNFFQSTYNWITSGGKVVSLEEAERRSEICLNCPHNGVYPRGRCPGCFARTAVKAITSGGAIPWKDNKHSKKLVYCKHCGCDLNVKVFLPLEVIVNEGVDYPEHCWQLDPINKKTPEPSEEGTGETT